MKKTLRMMGLCALIALAAVACKKEDQTTSSFKATLTQPTSEAKTHLGDGDSLLWNTGDAIKVFDENGNEYLFTTNDNNVTEATFTSSSSIDINDSYTAFYPAANTAKEGEYVKLTLAATQAYDANSFANGTYPMKANYNAADGFTFASDCGLLALQVKGSGSIGSIVLTSKTPTDMLAGDLKYSLDGNCQGIVNGQTTVTLNCGSVGLDATTPKVFYIALPAGVFAGGFTAVLNDIMGAELSTLSTTNDNHINASHIRMMPAVTVGATGVEIVEESAQADPTDPTQCTLSGTVTYSPGVVVEEVGFYYGLTAKGMNDLPSNLNHKVTLNEVPASGTSFEYTLRGLNGGTTYDYCIYIKISGNETYGTVQSFTTLPVSHLIDLSTLTTDYVAKDGDTLTGTLSDNYKISIAADATVTLWNADINGSLEWQWEGNAGITCLGNANLIIEGTNTVCSMGENECAIQAGPAGTTLTISGNGQLTANCKDGYEDGCYGAAIGGGYHKSAVGNIVINSGTIIAKGGYYAAAIGAGENTTCGNITIAEGVNLTAVKKGSWSSYCIGAGNGGSCGTITIGGTVRPDSVLPNQSDGVTYIYPFYTYTVTTGVATLASTSPISYTLNGSYVESISKAVTEVGFDWGTDATNLNNNVKAASVGTPFSCSLTGLVENTTYYYKAYVLNDGSKVYGSVESFSTNTPTMTTGTVTLTDSGTLVNTATGHVTLTNAGNLGEVSQIGLCWGTSSNPTIADGHAAAAGTTVNTEYAVTTPQLNSGITYYFRSYAKVGETYYYAGNEVSVKSYYLISTLEDWNALAALVNNGTDATANAVQMDNISGVTTIVGNASNPFKGKYNGQGYTISNVSISGTTNVGLFGYVNSASAVIENVVVASGMVSGSDVNVGAVVGQLSGGTVRYCANYAEVKSTSNPSNGRARVGGIVGMQASGGGDNNHVSYCINYGYVHGKGYVGGIVGGYGSGYISYSQNYGLVQASESTAGGVAGWQSFNAAKLTNSHNGGNVTVGYSGSGARRYLICNTNYSALSYSTNSYHSSMTLTVGSTTYTGSSLSQFTPGATSVTSNPAGITIGGTTYSWDTPAP